MDFPNPQSPFYVYQHIERYGEISTAGIGGSPVSTCPPVTCPIALSQLQAGTLPTGVLVPPSALPPATNTLAVVGDKLVSTVNGAIAEIAMGSLVNCASIKSAYPAAVSAAAATINLLTDSCTKLGIRRGTSAFGASLDYYVLNV